MKNKLFTLLGLIVLFSLQVNAQVEPTSEVNMLDMTLEELMNMDVYSASKMAQNATEAPAPIYIVTELQIKERNYSCLKDLLEDIPQIEIQKNAEPEIADIYTINGTAGNEKFIILMDGIRINSATGTAHTLGQSYSLANVKQVEIILGPASSLYGADAFTGVINILTYKGYENKGLHLSTSYGMFNTTDNTLTYGVGNKQVAFTVSGKYNYSEEPFFPDYYPEEFSWYKRYQETGQMRMFGDTIQLAGDPTSMGNADKCVLALY